MLWSVFIPYPFYGSAIFHCVETPHVFIRLLLCVVSTFCL